MAPTRFVDLGHAVSHGCVRLSVKNAATLWALVKAEKMASTSVVVRGDTPNAVAVARSGPLSLSPDNPVYAPPPQYQRVYDNRPALPKPFFIFGR